MRWVDKHFRHAKTLLEKQIKIPSFLFSRLARPRRAIDMGEKKTRPTVSLNGSWETDAAALHMHL